MIGTRRFEAEEDFFRSFFLYSFFYPLLEILITIFEDTKFKGAIYYPTFKVKDQGLVIIFGYIDAYSQDFILLNPPNLSLKSLFFFSSDIFSLLFTHGSLPPFCFYSIIFVSEGKLP